MESDGSTSFHINKNRKKFPMIKKYKEYHEGNITHDTFVESGVVKEFYDELEDQFVRMSEILNCDIEIKHHEIVIHVPEVPITIDVPNYQQVNVDNYMKATGPIIFELEEIKNRLENMYSNLKVKWIRGKRAYDYIMTFYIKGGIDTYSNLKQQKIHIPENTPMSIYQLLKYLKK
jgi:hypothetical protein